jgi:hypothetical protein
MSIQKSVGIVGGGTGVVRLAKRLMYDFEVTIYSQSLYSLDYQTRLRNALQYELKTEESLARLSDLCNVKLVEVGGIEQDTQGKYRVKGADGQAIDVLDTVVVSPALQVQPSTLGILRDNRSTVYSVTDPMSALRIRNNVHSMDPGHIVFYSAGRGSENQLTSVSVPSN